MSTNTIYPQSRANQAEDMADLALRAPGYRADVETITRNARHAFRNLRASSLDRRNKALLSLASLLEDTGERATLLAANQSDLREGESNGLRSNLLDRLKLDGKRIDAMATALREIAAMPDPLGEVVDGQRLANGIQMTKRRVPIGVVVTVYESRPNVTVDVGALCIKSGNCGILRGGKEARHSNRALFRLFARALAQAGLPEQSLQLVTETDRAYLLALLERDDDIDLVVPRGGEALIRFVSHNSRIPVVKHDRGVCNLYIDQDADARRATEIAINAKLQRTSVCNSIENLIIHSGFGAARAVLEQLDSAGAQLLGCERSKAIYPTMTLIESDQAEDEYGTEYLDNRLSVKIVDDIEGAVDFIYRYGSGHSEAIVSNDVRALRYFQSAVDAAAVFANCSTRFHDGGAMGMGAEVGISTGRLHVRGPMGVRDLTTTTYIMEGDGQIRS